MKPLMAFAGVAVVLWAATGKALPAVVIAALLLVVVHTVRSSVLHKRLRQRYLAGQQYYRATGRPIMREPVCAVCLRRLPDDGTLHECEAIATSVQVARDPETGNSYLQGCLEDGLTAIRWACVHEHDHADDARACAREHAQLHFDRSCHCSYYAMPMPPVFVSARNAYVYVMRSKKLGAVKVGTSARAFPVRVQEHVDNGWELVGAVLGLSGAEAYLVEQEVLAGWRVAGYRLGVRADEMPQKGHTETVSLLVVDPEDTLAQVCARTGRDAHRSVLQPAPAVQVVRVVDVVQDRLDEGGRA